MEMHPIFHFPPPWSFFFSPFQSSPFAPPNYVHWRETASSHLYSASLPGIRKEEIRVEIENSAYLLIRTELNNTGTEGPAAQTGNNLEDGTEGGTKQKRFYRKFRLPVRADLDGVTARYENGLLTVTVPRLIHRAGFRIGFSDLDRVDNSVARAA